MHIPPNWGTFFALIVSFLVFWFIFSRIFFRPFLDFLAVPVEQRNALSAHYRYLTVLERYKAFGMAEQ